MDAKSWVIIELGERKAYEYLEQTLGEDWDLVKQVASEAIQHLPKNGNHVLAANYTHPESCAVCLAARVRDKARELAELYAPLLEDTHEAWGYVADGIQEERSGRAWERDYGSGPTSERDI